MECELCGKPISDKPIKSKIEGSVMSVCEECAKLGRIQKEPKKPKFKSKPKKPKANKPQQKQQNYFRRDEPSEELVEDYADLIRHKREANKWSREELAGKIFEKTSVISRLETGKMVPDNKLAKKLEKTLNITLLVEIDSLDIDQYTDYTYGDATLADIVKIKKK